MPGTILTELHGRRIGLDEKDNLVLAKGAGVVGVNVLNTVTFVIAAGAASSNISNVTIQLVDVLGNAISRVSQFDVWLSDAATGIGLTATSPSTGIAAGASGTVMGVLTTGKAVRAQSNASGVFILAITDTAKTAFYPCVTLGDRAAIVGTQLATASYG